MRILFGEVTFERMLVKFGLAQPCDPNSPFPAGSLLSVLAAGPAVLRLADSSTTDLEHERRFPNMGCLGRGRTSENLGGEVRSKC